MKKNVLNRVKGAILTKDEAKTISGGYTGGSFIDGSPCSFIICGANENKGPAVATPAGCSPRSLYIYKPNPSLYCVVL